MKDFPQYDTPIALDNVAGANIEYDHRFLDLERLAEGSPEQQYGNVLIEAKEPDWTTLEKLCKQLLSESKDIRVFSYYILILTAKHGLIGFEAGCQALRTNLENFWLELYPKLVDEDGEDNEFARVNALGILLSIQWVVKYLGRATLLNNGLNQQAIMLKDAYAILQNDDKVEYFGGKERLMLDIRVGFDVKKNELISLQKSYEHLLAIKKIYDSNLQYESPPSFEKILKLLESIINVAEHDDQIQTENTVIETTDYSIEIDAPTQTIIPTQAKMVNAVDAWRSATMTNRKDVELVLEKICLYFEEYEPSHPAPLFIRRIQKLMNMDFYEIMKNINPDGLEKLEVLIGKRDEENSEYND